MPMLDSDEEMNEEPVYQRGNRVPSQNCSPEQDNVVFDTEGERTDSTCDKRATMPNDEDSGFSFSLDLGPSILEDVLQVMDKLHN